MRGLQLSVHRPALASSYRLPSPSEAKPGRVLFLVLLSLGLVCTAGARAAGPLRTLTDGVGRKIQVPSTPRRIVSLAPSVTETLFALGAGDRVVGVTDFCDYPPAALTRPRIGGLVNPSWEAVLALRPDLVIGTTAGNDRTLVDQAANLHLPLFFLDAPDIKGTIQSISILGDLVGTRAAAARLQKTLRERLERLKPRSHAGRRPRVLFLVWGEPLVVPGGGTFLDDALRRAGCDSVTSDAPPGWPTYDLEAILLLQPDWILSARPNASFLETLKGRPGWEELEAVRMGRVATISASIERPSPRVVDAMEELQQLVGEGSK